jgi:putative DNA primase/helicase
VQKTGWFQSVFVLPDRTLGARTEQVLYQAEKASRHYAQAGTLSEWQQHVARLCAGNSRLVLSVCAAFAAPLLELVGQDSGGVHFVGPSSIGKTTMLGVGASVYGGPGYIQTWRATGNGLEGLAAMHNHTLLVLDEMGEVDPKEAGSIAYMIGNGTGKARSDRQGDTRARKTWRLLFLSSGEVGLAQHMSEGGKAARAGQEVRLIDLPADAGAGHGAFEELHGFESGGQLSNALKEATRHYYGTAALAFIEALTIDFAVLPKQIKGAIAGFINEYLPDGAGGQATRVCARFAIMAAAGELATGVTGWEAGAAKKAAAICFKAWLDQRGGAGNSERITILAAVRAFIETHGEARFAQIDPDHDRPTINRAGFRKLVNGHDEYYVLSEAYKRDVCAGFNPRTVTKVLLDAGWLQPGKDGKSLQKKSLPNLGETRVYVLTAAMWEDGDVV